MRLVLGSVIITLLATEVAFAQADPDRSVSGSGIQVKGWQGRTDRSGQKIGDVKFVQMGTGYHLTNGPHAIVWNNGNRATGDYTVKARLTKHQKARPRTKSPTASLSGGLTSTAASRTTCIASSSGRGT
jgi:hypothetical protein